MEARIKFSAEVYISGDNLEQIRDDWENFPLFSADALERHADFSEVLLVEKVDDDSYTDYTTEFKCGNVEQLINIK